MNSSLFLSLYDSGAHILSCITPRTKKSRNHADCTRQTWQSHTSVTGSSVSNCLLRHEGPSEHTIRANSLLRQDSRLQAARESLQLARLRIKMNKATLTMNFAHVKREYVEML